MKQQQYRTVIGMELEPMISRWRCAARMETYLLDKISAASFESRGSHLLRSDSTMPRTETMGSGGARFAITDIALELHEGELVGGVRVALDIGTHVDLHNVPRDRLWNWEVIKRTSGEEKEEEYQIALMVASVTDQEDAVEAREDRRTEFAQVLRRRARLIVD